MSSLQEISQKLGPTSDSLYSSTTRIEAKISAYFDYVKDKDDRALSQLEAQRESSRGTRGIAGRGTTAPAPGGIGAGGILGGLGGGFAALGAGMMNSAKGIVAMGLAIPAFFGGLLAGSAGLDWLQQTKGMDYEGLKKAAMGFSDIITSMDPESFVVLGGIMAVSAVGGTRAAKGLGSMGFGISAFFAGLLAGDALFKGVTALAGENAVNFAGLKAVAVGFSDMILSIDEKSLTVLAGLLGAAAIVGLAGGSTEVPKAMGLMGIGITAFLAGLLLGDTFLAGASALGADLNFAHLKTALVGFSDSITGLTEDGVIALGAIMGISGLAAKFNLSGAKTAAFMTSLGAGISGFLGGLILGDVAISWLNKLKASDSPGIVSAFGIFNNSVETLNEKSLKAFGLILATATGLGVLSTAVPGSALVAAGGIGAIMTALGVGISGFLAGIVLGDAALSWLGKLKASDSQGMSGAFKVFNDSINAIDESAMSKMEKISNLKIGGELKNLSLAMIGFFTAEGMNEAASLYSKVKDFITNGINLIFRTNLGEGKKSAIETMLDGLAPLMTIDQKIFEKINMFSAALDSFYKSFNKIASANIGEGLSKNISKIMQDLSTVLDFMPDPSDPKKGNILTGGTLSHKWLGKKYYFGGGLNNLTDENLEQLETGVGKMYKALGIDLQNPGPRTTSEALQPLNTNMQELTRSINNLVNQNTVTTVNQQLKYTPTPAPFDINATVQ